MQKCKMGVFFGDKEYGERLLNFLRKNYENQFELHQFTTGERLLKEGIEGYEILLLGNCAELLNPLLDRKEAKIIYLLELEEEISLEEDYVICEEKRITFVDKYQDISRIVDEIKGMAAPEEQWQGKEKLASCIGIYSLGHNEYQLPFLLTMGAILGEKEKVLVLDLQENSGFSQFNDQEEPDGDKCLGLEEVLAMAELSDFSREQLSMAIGHLDHLDYIYPVENSECLSELTLENIQKILVAMEKEFGYERVLINFGPRFQGFFSLMNACNQVYLMGKNRGILKWREKEFYEELSRRGYGTLQEQILRVELPLFTSPVTTCQRMIQEWKWDELGDYIRRMLPREVSLG